MIPANRPKITRDDALARIAHLQHQGHGIAGVFPVVLIGLRGYYRDTMGERGKNDRGIYDDALVLIGPEHFSAYNANTDPSYGFRKHLATLRAGLWKYKLGTHGFNRPAAQRYQALIQAGAVTVDRDAEDADTGFFGINIHRGGVNTTSSLGCQTLPPGQWPSFIANVKDQLTRADQKIIPYALLETK